MSIPKVCALAAALAVLSLTPASAGQKLDEGKLDTGWFGDDREFRKADEIDYLWVKPGFSLSGKKVQFAEWNEPQFMGEKAGERDAKDKRLANNLTGDMPEIFAEAFRNGLAGTVTVVESGGEVKVVGRIVDCTEGSAAAKFWVGMGAGSGSTTFDMKFLDAKSGELVAAIHHRVVSGSNLSTTDSKFVKWVDEFAERLAKKGLEALYNSGKRAKD
ncbi:MAG: DUF4410 domain-containing protein [Thermoanaerobaculia bacterium]|jgi:hypothetical protein|nr:DUF4410 domain-containing protein [Thermoanaerobaculia bacterium]MBP9824567.1 DUF4410 domain-containing protein [Thermoanaerobaculia bacterium]